MLPFQSIAAVVGMIRLVPILLMIRVPFIRILGQPFMNTRQCLIVRFEAGVWGERIRLRALEVLVGHLPHDKDAGVVYRIKNYAVIVLVEHAPLSTIHTAPLRCSRICVRYVDRAKLGFAGRRGDCEGCIVFVLRLSACSCQKVRRVGSKIYRT